MEFIKLTTIFEERVLLNISKITQVYPRNEGSFVHLNENDSRPISVKESPEYIEQHLYVCNRSYVNGADGD